MAKCTCIRLKTVDQRLTVVQQPVLSSGDVGTVRVEYELDSYWDGYTPSGTFYTGKRPEDVYEQPLTDGACVVPWEVLQEDGVLYIGLRGVDGSGLVKTAAPVRYRIEKGSPIGSATAAGPTPDIYQQLLATAKETKDIAQSVRDDAASGAFDGETGPAGPTGIHVGPEAPEDGRVAWIDTDEEDTGADLAPPDLAENDPNAAGYVKNRTHYSELVDAVLFPEQTITISGNQCLRPGLLGLVAGETYTVVWAGTTYTCVAEERTLNRMPFVGLGNPVFTGGENNNMPFGVGEIVSEGFSGFMAMVDGDYTVSVTGKKEVVHKLDAKYVNEFRVHVANTGTNHMALHTIKELVEAIEAGKRLYILDQTYATNGTVIYKRYDLVSAEYNKALLEQEEIEETDTRNTKLVFVCDTVESGVSFLDLTWKRSLFMLSDIITGGQLHGGPYEVVLKETTD